MSASRRTTRKLIVEAIAMWIIAFAMLGLLWTVTGGPMIRNYQECGTIFLCANQPHGVK